MKCPRCSAELPDQSKFCFSCGSSVSGSGAAQPSADHFELLQKYIPPELAKRILSAGKQIEGERRHVTILFADVSGFTAIAEKFDPEIVTTVLNDCFRGLISSIFKFEGTIDKFIGDEIMAIFGAPLAHENDPERAIRCALEMTSYIEQFNILSPIPLPVPLKLHIGLNSGTVISGNVGSDLRLNYSIIGDTVNLAARLVQMAPPGDIYLSGQTHKLVSDLVVAEGPYPTNIKGKEESVDIYKLRSLKLGIDTAKPSTGKDEFVGRQKELEQIAFALGDAAHKQEKRIFIQGEPGVGKTSLKNAVIKLARLRNVITFESKCSGFEHTTPYFLWNTLLKNLLRLTGEMNGREIGKRLHETLQILSLESYEPYLATLLSLRYEKILLEDDDKRKEKIFEGVRELLRTYAKCWPTMFILEDLHWIDPFSQELLEYIFSKESAAPAFFLLLYRNEYAHSKKITAYGEVLNLNRFSREESAKLMRLRLEADSIPPKIEELIHTRSEGNPLFIEELIKTLLDKRTIAIRRRAVEILTSDIESVIPETIQGIMMARIDRLEDSMKEVLFKASIIGREFSRPVLEQIVRDKGSLPSNLIELGNLDLVLQKESGQETEYLFKQYLIQEVAYNTFLLNKRKELHLLVAEAIEKVYPDRLKDLYEVLAFHYEKAEKWDKAAEYLSRAGQKALGLYTQKESNEFFQRQAAAVVKLFEAGNTKATFRGTISALLTAPLPFIFISMPLVLVLFLRSTGRLDEFNEYWFFEIPFYFLTTWFGVFLLFTAVFPIARGRPQLYHILESQLQIVFKDEGTFYIDFSDIEQYRYLDPKAVSSRPFRYKLLDPLFRISEYSEMSFKNWMIFLFLGRIPGKLSSSIWQLPYSLGLGSKNGEIQIRKKSGADLKRMIMPWLHTPQQSREIGLSPVDPGEFYEQFEIAYKKWKRKKM